MTLFQWSLGAYVSGKLPSDSKPEPSKLENTVLAKMRDLTVSDGESFFCESQPATPPAGQKVDPSQYVTQPNTPTILVEMWHNIPDETLPLVINRICHHVQCTLAPSTGSASAGNKAQ